MSLINGSDSNAVQIKPSAEGGFLVSGALTFETAPSAWQSSVTLLGALPNGGEDITFDLQGVSHTDSAGLALLIEWMRAASEQKKRITFKNLPPQMLAIATVSGLENILPTA